VLYSFGGGTINLFAFNGFFFAKSFLILTADIDRPVLGISRRLLCGVKLSDESSRRAKLDLRAIAGTPEFFVVYGGGLPILSSIS